MTGQLTAGRQASAHTKTRTRTHMRAVLYTHNASAAIVSYSVNRKHVAGPQGSSADLPKLQ